MFASEALVSGISPCSEAARGGSRGSTWRSPRRSRGEISCPAPSLALGQHPRGATRPAAPIEPAADLLYAYGVFTFVASTIGICSR